MSETKRCPAMLEGQRCGLRAGHGRDHTLLIPSAEPWFAPPVERPCAYDLSEVAKLRRKIGRNRR